MLLEVIATPTTMTVANITGFLPLQEWRPFLQSLPDQHLALFLERGMKYGFQIEVDPTKQIQSAASNMLSVSQCPDIVDKYIAEEVASSRLVPETATQIDPIGIISKKNR